MADIRLPVTSPTPAPGWHLPHHMPSVNLTHLHLVGHGANWTGNQVLGLIAVIAVLVLLAKRKRKAR